MLRLPKPIGFTFALCSVLLYGIKPDRADTIPLTPRGGVFTVPGQINNKVSLDFIVDSGAAVVLLPDDVYQSLLRGGETKPEDSRGTFTFTMANGAKIKAPRIMLRSVTVGDATIYNVIASVAPAGGPPVLGQSFLARLPSWTIDNNKHTLFVDTAIWHKP